MSGVIVHGRVAPGFEAVGSAFEQNFERRDELGAAFAVYRDDQLVVDLWGGTADAATGSSWREETVQVMFSGTKGWVATCLLILLERGLLELDAPVSRYWPEFGESGKGATLVRHFVAHLAGLPGVRQILTEKDICDSERMAELLEREPPYWPPGERLAYHPLTFGWLCGELVRRIDGRAIGRFFADEVAAPLGLDAWIGLPAAEEPRVATLELGASWDDTPERREAKANAFAATVWDNPRGRHADPLAQNTRAFHAAEIPGAGGIATVRSVARLYACLVRGGELDGMRLLAPETIEMGRRCISRGQDALVDRQRAFGVGFELQTEVMRLGPFPSAFGHSGAGGSVHGAWPEQRVAFSYAMNELRGDDPDPRAQALLLALKVSLDECAASTAASLGA